MMKSTKRSISFFVLSAFLFLQILPYLPSSVQNIPLVSTLKKASLFNPSEIDAVGLSSASATLSNPRLSFDAIVGTTTIPIGGTVAITQASGVGSDYDTLNLFPLDNVVITGNSAILVAAVVNTTTFTLTTPLTVAATAGSAHMTVAQSGTMTMVFTTSAPIPLGGSIKISIPAPTANGNDGIPLAATSLATNGFDTNGMSNANTTCPGGFTASTFTTGVGVPHTFTCNNAGALVPSGAAITFVVGNGAIGLVNPAPTQNRTSVQRGIADIYTITARTYDGLAGAGTLLESIDMKTAPVEGVLVSATVDETLQFTVAGVAAGATTRCGKLHTAGITTTATSVPWSLLSSGYTIDKNEAVQQLIVTTNASNGYKVYAEENDQMGEEGSVCAGLAGAHADNPTAGDYTFGSNDCIRDVAGGSNNALFDWGTTPASIYGFGYAIENGTGTDGGTGIYTTGGKVYGARAFSDMQNNEDKYAAGTELMSNAAPVSSNSVYVCYRINIPGTQPAGYYYNKIKYTAVPKF